MTIRTAVHAPEIDQIAQVADHAVQHVADALVWVVFRLSGVRS